MNKGFIQALIGGTKRDDGPTHKRPNIGEKVARTVLGVGKRLHGPSSGIVGMAPSTPVHLYVAEGGSFLLGVAV